MKTLTNREAVMDYINELRADLQSAQEEAEKDRSRSVLEIQRNIEMTVTLSCLQSRIDNAPEYWAVRPIGKARWSILATMDELISEDTKQVFGERLARVRLLEIPKPEQREE